MEKNWFFRYYFLIIPRFVKDINFPGLFFCMKYLSSLFNNLLESIGEGIMISDSEGTLVAVNEEFCSLLGYNKEALIGKQFISLFSPHERDTAFYLHQQNLSGNTDREDSWNGHLIKKNGYEIAVAATLFCVMNDQGEKLQGMIVKKMYELVPEFDIPDLHLSILHNIKDSVVVVRVDGTILYWNQGASDIYEYREEEVVGKLIYKFWPEENFSQFVQYFKSGNAKLDLFDSPHTRRDGQIRYVDFRITPLYDKNESLAGLIFVSQDVTERYQHKKAIREQRNMLASLVDSQSNFLIRLDTEGRYTFVNKAYSGQVESQENIEGDTFVKHVFPEDIPVWNKAFKNALKTSALRKVELRMVREGGEFFWASWELVGITDKKGRITKVQAVGVDVSDRKRMEKEREIYLEKVQSLNRSLLQNEEELRNNLEKTLRLNAEIERNEKKFKSLLENSFEAVLVFNEAGVIQYASPSIEGILGFAMEEMVGVKSMNFVHEEDKPAVKSLLKEVMASLGEPVYIEHRARKKSGDYIFIESYCTNLLNDENVRGIVSNYRDVTERKEAEEYLRKSEASLSLAQHIAKFGSVEFDLLNGTARQSTGLYAIYDFDLSKHEENEFNGFDYIHPDDVEKVKSYFGVFEEFGPEWLKEVRHLAAEKLEQLENNPFEYRIISAAGKVKYVRSFSRTIYDESGLPVKNIVTIQDVSEERHLERMLEDTSNMAKTGGWELHLDSKQYFATPQALRMIGLPPGSLIPMSGNLDFYHPDYRPVFQNAMEDLIANGTSFDLELIKLTADKEEFWAREIGRAEMVNGKVVLVKGFTQDITDRKKAEKEIQKYADRLRIATEAAGIGVWDWDLQQDKMVWDSQMRKIFGIPADDSEVGYDIWKNIVHPEDLGVLESSFPQILTKRKSEMQFRIVMPSGAIKWVKSFSKVFTDAEGNPKRLVGVDWDISKIKEAEEVLRRNNEELLKINNELDHFVYSTSHNLRAPLTSILGIVGLIKNFPDPSEFDNYIALIEKSVKKLDDTIQEITNYSRNARVEVVAESINFECLVEEMVESLSFLENAGKIKITYTMPPKFPFFSDLSRIKMIITNLLSNAIKYADYTKANPFIKILLKHKEEGVCISIQDNGIGIASEYQAKVFDMFFRASTRSSGSGLGLYIVKEAVTKLDGKIEVVSTPGIGTEFRVYLPDLKAVSK